MPLPLPTSRTGLPNNSRGLVWLQRFQLQPFLFLMMASPLFLQMLAVQCYLHCESPAKGKGCLTACPHCFGHA
jgi:hypothetical protein